MEPRREEMSGKRGRSGRESEGKKKEGKKEGGSLGYRVREKRREKGRAGMGKRGFGGLRRSISRSLLWVMD